MRGVRLGEYGRHRMYYAEFHTCHADCHALFTAGQRSKLGKQGVLASFGFGASSHESLSQVTGLEIRIQGSSNTPKLICTAKTSGQTCRRGSFCLSLSLSFSLFDKLCSLLG